MRIGVYPLTLRLSKVNATSSPSASLTKTLLNERSIIRESSMALATNCPIMRNICVRFLSKGSYWINRINPDKEALLTVRCHWQYHLGQLELGIDHVDGEHIDQSERGPHLSISSDHDGRIPLTPKNKIPALDQDQCRPLRNTRLLRSTTTNHTTRILSQPTRGYVPERCELSVVVGDPGSLHHRHVLSYLVLESVDFAI